MSRGGKTTQVVLECCATSLRLLLLWCNILIVLIVSLSHCCTILSSLTSFAEMTLSAGNVLPTPMLLRTATELGNKIIIYYKDYYRQNKSFFIRGQITRIVCVAMIQFNSAVFIQRLLQSQLFLGILHKQEGKTNFFSNILTIWRPDPLSGATLIFSQSSRNTSNTHASTDRWSFPVTESSF